MYVSLVLPSLSFLKQQLKQRLKTDIPFLHFVNHGDCSLSPPAYQMKPYIRCLLMILAYILGVCSGNGTWMVDDERAYTTYRTCIPHVAVLMLITCSRCGLIANSRGKLCLNGQIWKYRGKRSYQTITDTKERMEGRGKVGAVLAREEEEEVCGAFSP